MQKQKVEKKIQEKIIIHNENAPAKFHPIKHISWDITQWNETCSVLWGNLLFISQQDDAFVFIIIESLNDLNITIITPFYYLNIHNTWTTRPKSS
jgi:hypothetical protein